MAFATKITTIFSENAQLLFYFLNFTIGVTFYSEITSMSVFLFL